jgi:hypothetical protein
MLYEAHAFNLRNDMRDTVAEEQIKSNVIKFLV